MSRYYLPESESALINNSRPEKQTPLASSEKFQPPLADGEKMKNGIVKPEAHIVEINNNFHVATDTSLTRETTSPTQEGQQRLATKSVNNAETQTNDEIKEVVEQVSKSHSKLSLPLVEKTVKVVTETGKKFLSNTKEVDSQKDNSNDTPLIKSESPLQAKRQNQTTHNRILSNKVQKIDVDLDNSQISNETHVGSFLPPAHICEICNNREFSNARSLKNHLNSKLHKESVTKIDLPVNRKCIVDHDTSNTQNFICVDGQVYTKANDVLVTDQYECIQFNNSNYIPTKTAENNKMVLGNYATIVNGMLYKISADKHVNSSYKVYVNDFWYIPEVDENGEFIIFTGSNKCKVKNYIMIDGCFYEHLNMSENDKSCIYINNECYKKVVSTKQFLKQLKPRTTILSGMFYTASGDDAAGMNYQVVQNQIYLPVMSDDGCQIRLHTFNREEKRTHKLCDSIASEKLCYDHNFLSVKYNKDILTTLHNCSVYLCNNCLAATQAKSLRLGKLNGCDNHVLTICLCKRCVYLNAGYSKSLNLPIIFKNSI